MAKLRNVLGLMSGTSMDGIDAALLRTDGQDYCEFLGSGFTPYPEEARQTLRAALGQPQENDPKVKLAEDLVTQWHIRAVHEFAAKTNHTIDLVGFHGQTIFHAPEQGRTWQLGRGHELATKTGIDVVYDFRSNDMAYGGQGAPLLPVYHQALVRRAGLPGPVCVLNLGGVANITWLDGETLIACDTGPANALIDDWMLRKTGTPQDTGGTTAAKGRPETTRLALWLAHPFFAKPAPKSLDRNSFAACSVDDLTLEDGAATLTALTVETVFKALNLMPAMPKTLVVAGGGRHNAEIMRLLNNRLPAINADTLGWHGDSLEAEGFAYMAARAIAAMPLSFPGTTGCKMPVSGGKTAKAR